MNIPASPSPPTSYEFAAWILAAAALILVLVNHLVGALLAGLLVHELVRLLSPRLRLTHLTGRRAKVVTVALLATLIVGLLTLVIVATVGFLRSGTESVPILLHKMAEIIENSRSNLPQWLSDSLPTDTEDLKAMAVNWLHENASELQRVGKGVALGFAHVLIGMIIGAIISLREVTADHHIKLLPQALSERAWRLSESFRRVVFAQVRIAALNTFFTWIYLAIALPIAGIELPFMKTLIAITFFAGLLPVLGNLISNTVIVVVSLSQSFYVALTSLIFLMVIHKLEYFLNARIIGGQIHARAWELLVAMLAMESAFGIAGLVAAPIYYAYIKDELKGRELI